MHLQYLLIIPLVKSNQVKNFVFNITFGRIEGRLRATDTWRISPVPMQLLSPLKLSHACVYTQCAKITSDKHPQKIKLQVVYRSEITALELCWVEGEIGKCDLRFIFCCDVVEMQVYKQNVRDSHNLYTESTVRNFIELLKQKMLLKIFQLSKKKSRTPVRYCTHDHCVLAGYLLVVSKIILCLILCLKTAV